MKLVIVALLVSAMLLAISQSSANSVSARPGLNSLQFHDKTTGLETMCVGGGQGMAMIVERLS